MKPYGSKRSFDTEPRIKSARALVKREGEALIEEQGQAVSKTAALAAQWTHGLEAARKRLAEMIENGERFDARDRQALAFLLLAVGLLVNHTGD